MSVDLTRSGQWRECKKNTPCSAKFHFDMSLEEMETAPRHILLQLIETFDPPRSRYYSQEYWNDRLGRHVFVDFLVKEWIDHNGAPHRDYGLPARIWPTGVIEYFYHGKMTKRERLSDAR